MGGELWCGQAQNGENLDFQVKFDLEDKGRSVHKTKGTLTKVFCIFGQNLWPYLERVPSYRTDKQVIDTHADRQTDRHTHRRRQQYPKAKTGLG